MSWRVHGRTAGEGGRLQLRAAGRGSFRAELTVTGGWGRHAKDSQVVRGQHRSARGLLGRVCWPLTRARVSRCHGLLLTADVLPGTRLRWDLDGDGRSVPGGRFRVLSAAWNARPVRLEARPRGRPPVVSQLVLGEPWPFHLM